MRLKTKINVHTHEDVINCLNEAGLHGLYTYENDVTVITQTLDMECCIESESFKEACFNLADGGYAFEVIVDADMEAE